MQTSLTLKKNFFQKNITNLKIIPNFYRICASFIIYEISNICVHEFAAVDMFFIMTHLLSLIGFTLWRWNVKHIFLLLLWIINVKWYPYHPLACVKFSIFVLFSRSAPNSQMFFSPIGATVSVVHLLLFSTFKLC